MGPGQASGPEAAGTAIAGVDSPGVSGKPFALVASAKAAWHEHIMATDAKKIGLFDKFILSPTAVCNPSNFDIPLSVRIHYDYHVDWEKDGWSRILFC